MKKFLLLFSCLGLFLAVACGDDAPAPECGDGTVDTAELCDDGNTTDGDGCSADCASDETCGNGTVDGVTGETCDDGNTTAADGCSAVCQSEVCGNSTIDPDEVCDDGNTTDGDGCSATCLSDETCSNGVVDAVTGEVCDDSNTTDGDGCSANCLSDETCGNTIVDSAAGEECDDGNLVNDDECDNSCLFVITCNDGTLDPGEDTDTLPGPSTTVPVDELTCRYDFSGLEQLYCSGTCGNWGGDPDGCDQGDADAFCKLKMDNPLSTATSFDVGTALDAPGVCCPPPTIAPGGLGCVDLGTFTDRGVDLNVSVHDTSVLSNHGGGAIVHNVVCTDP